MNKQTKRPQEIIVATYEPALPPAQTITAQLCNLSDRIAEIEKQLADLTGTLSAVLVTGSDTTFGTEMKADGSAVAVQIATAVYRLDCIGHNIVTLIGRVDL